jgi:hypothetical protein
MRVLATLSEDEHKRYRELFIQEQLVHAGGYMNRVEAGQALRAFTLYTQEILHRNDIDPEDDYVIDVHLGVIASEE